MLVRPGKKGLLAHTLYYNDELRADTEFAPDLSAVSPKELTLAKSFVEAIAGPFAPEEFKDNYREQLQDLIAAKTARQEIAPAARAATAPAPVVDIMEALTKSLERAKKEAPPAPPRREPGKATTDKGEAPQSITPARGTRMEREPTGCSEPAAKKRRVLPEIEFTGQQPGEESVGQNSGDCRDRATRPLIAYRWNSG